jgi:hypothetical protein
LNLTSLVGFTDTNNGLELGSISLQKATISFVIFLGVVWFRLFSISFRDNAGAETRETRQRFPVESPATCYVPHLVKIGSALFKIIVERIISIEIAMTPYAMRMGLVSFETYLLPSNLSPRYSPITTIGMESEYNTTQDKVEFGR